MKEWKEQDCFVQLRVDDDDGDDDDDDYIDVYGLNLVNCLKNT